VVESIFGVPFEKTRPDFLNNHVTKNNLELDCYNADLKIAVEFDGRQHYEFVPFFHRNEDAFRAQQYRDYMKQKKCEENGILLIRVPYTTTLEQIEPYIRSSLRAAGYNY
jgi:very-short-patch-repair endonuclease